MQPEFVNHLVGVFTPSKSLSVTVRNVSGNLLMKSTTVGWSQLLAGANVCEENTVPRALVFRKIHKLMQVENRPSLLLVLSIRIDR